MSVLGPVSMLGRYVAPGTHAKIFAQGEMPAGVNFSRNSKACRITQDGFIEEVDVSAPLFTWVAEARAYGLAVEPAATNLLTRSLLDTPTSWSNGIYLSGVDDPMNSNAAVRVSGRSSIQSDVALSRTPLLGRYKTVQIITRKAGTNNRFNIFPRNATKGVGAPARPWVNFNNMSWNDDPEAVVEFSYQKLARDYWLLNFTWDFQAPSMIAAGFEQGDNIGWYWGSNGALDTVADVAYRWDIANIHCIDHGWNTTPILMKDAPNVRASSSLAFPLTNLWLPTAGGAFLGDLSYSRNSGPDYLAVSAFNSNDSRLEVFVPAEKGVASTSGVVAASGTTSRSLTRTAQSGRIRFGLKAQVGSLRAVAINGGITTSGSTLTEVPAFASFNMTSRRVNNCGCVYMHQISLLTEQITAAEMARKTEL